MNKAKETWKRYNIVKGFLDCFDPELIDNWPYSLEETYNKLKAGDFGEVWWDGVYYNVHVPDGHVYSWDERVLH